MLVKRKIIARPNSLKRRRKNWGGGEIWRRQSRRRQKLHHSALLGLGQNLISPLLNEELGLPFANAAAERDGGDSEQNGCSEKKCSDPQWDLDFAAGALVHLAVLIVGAVVQASQQTQGIVAIKRRHTWGGSYVAIWQHLMILVENVNVVDTCSPKSAFLIAVSANVIRITPHQLFVEEIIGKVCLVCTDVKINKLQQSESTSWVDDE